MRLLKVLLLLFVYTNLNAGERTNIQLIEYPEFSNIDIEQFNFSTKCDAGLGYTIFNNPSSICPDVIAMQNEYNTNILYLGSSISVTSITPRGPEKNFIELTCSRHHQEGDVIIKIFYYLEKETVNYVGKIAGISGVDYQNKVEIKEYPDKVHYTLSRRDQYQHSIIYELSYKSKEIACISYYRFKIFGSSNGYNYKFNTNRVNLLENPSIESKVKDLLVGLVSFNIIEINPSLSYVNNESGNWVKIQTDSGKIGWVWGNLIDNIGSP